MAQGDQATFVPNEIYDLLKVAATKLEGLAAYRQYAQDSGSTPLWQELRQQDEAATRRVLGQLHRLMHDPRYAALFAEAGERR
jgi:hypothetical protein